MPEPADRLKHLPPYVFTSIAKQIQKLKAQGHDIIRLDIGSPDGAPPPAVSETAQRSIALPDNHGYTSYNGTPAFRRAVASFYQSRFGVTLNPDTQVLPLIGSKEGLVNLCLAYLNPGDLVLVPDIGYPAYARGILLAGAEICWLPLRENNGFLPDLTSIPTDVAQRARMLWLNYPNNPTGAVARLDFFEQAVEFCRAHDILLLSDNPYFEITFDGEQAVSALQPPLADSCAIEMMSFSKTYNMGGWRLGAAVGNEEILRILLQMKSNVDTGHFLPIYEAGIAALEETSADWGAQRNQMYQRRRDLMLAALPDAGLDPIPPKGAIYIWARVQNGDGATYAHDALEQAHVSLTPGDAFGPGGTQYVRISLCTPDEQMQLALERLKRWHSQNSR